MDKFILCVANIECDQASSLRMLIAHVGHWNDEQQPIGAENWCADRSEVRMKSHHRTHERQGRTQSVIAPVVQRFDHLPSLWSQGEVNIVARVTLPGNITNSNPSPQLEADQTEKYSTPTRFPAAIRFSLADASGVKQVARSDWLPTNQAANLFFVLTTRERSRRCYHPLLLLL